MRQVGRLSMSAYKEVCMSSASTGPGNDPDVRSWQDEKSRQRSNFDKYAGQRRPAKRFRYHDREGAIGG
jgi:hypothetical protein